MSRAIRMVLFMVTITLAVGLLSGCFPKQPGVHLTHFESEAPAVGEQAPDFDLPGLDGEQVRLSDLYAERPVVVQLGSHSCPVYRYRRHSMDDVWDDYADRVHFLLVYTTEAHPVGSKSPHAEGEWDPLFNRLTGVRVRQPATEAARRQQAATSHDKLELPIPMVVDGLDDAVWADYGRAASPVFVIDSDGVVRLSLAWVHPQTVRDTLDQLLKDGSQAVR